jgi:hypothetical protein
LGRSAECRAAGDPLELDVDDPGDVRDPGMSALTWRTSQRGELTEHPTTWKRFLECCLAMDASPGV